MSAAAPQQSWPDEVRSMVDALMHGGACPHVEQQLLSWIVSTGYAHSGFNEQTGWWLDGRRMSAAVVLAELLQRSDTVAPAQTLSNRILVAVPTARTVTTDDGIEVSVGSKSVRWKQEKRGWSLGDDLFASDDRVVEHAKGMAVDDAAETQWKLATELSSRLKAKGIETCTVRNLDTGVVTVSAKDAAGHWHSAELRDGRWHYSGVELMTTAEAYRVLLEAAAPPKPAAPQPSPRALDTTQATASKRSPRELAAHELVALFQREFPGAAVGFKGDGSCVWVEQYSERVEWEQTATGRWERPEEIAFGAEGTVPLTRHLLDAAAKRRGCSTVTVNTSVFDPREAEATVQRLMSEHDKRAESATVVSAAALSRLFGEHNERILALFAAGKYSEAAASIEALTEELKAKQAAAKGPTTMTQDPERRRHHEGVVMAELCREVLRKHPNAVASARVEEPEQGKWYYTLALCEVFYEVEVQYENGRFYLYRNDATDALSLTLEQVRASLLAFPNTIDHPHDDNARARMRCVPTKRAVVHDIERIAPYSQWIAERQKRNEGARTMTTKALDQAKVDASEAALRTAAKQLAKAARDPLAGAVARHLAPGDDGMRAKVAAMLETEAGLAMLKAMLSLALGAIPQAGTRGAALAHELRVQAMADGADLALDLVMGPLREVVALYLQDAPGAPAAAPALDEPQHAPASVDWSKEREVSR